MDEENSSKYFRDDGILMKTISESIPPDSLPEASEKSFLLSEKTRSAIYVALPSVAQGRKWVLLYRLGTTSFMLLIFQKYNGVLLYCLGVKRFMLTWNGYLET